MINLDVTLEELNLLQSGCFAICTRCCDEECETCNVEKLINKLSKILDENNEE